MSPLVLALVIAALILAAVDQFMARGRSLTCWAVILVVLALLVPALSTI